MKKKSSRSLLMHLLDQWVLKVCIYEQRGGPGGVTKQPPWNRRFARSAKKGPHSRWVSSWVERMCKGIGSVSSMLMSRVLSFLFLMCGVGSCVVKGWNSKVKQFQDGAEPPWCELVSLTTMSQRLHVTEDGRIPRHLPEGLFGQLTLHHVLDDKHTCVSWLKPVQKKNTSS